MAEKLTDKEKQHLILEERKVKALEKIAASTDALALWFEEKEFSQWDERAQFYLHEFMNIAKASVDAKS